MSVLRRRSEITHSPANVHPILWCANDASGNHWLRRRWLCNEVKRTQLSESHTSTLSFLLCHLSAHYCQQSQPNKFMPLETVLLNPSWTMAWRALYEFLKNFLLRQKIIRHSLGQTTNQRFKISWPLKWAPNGIVKQTQPVRTLQGRILGEPPQVNSLVSAWFSMPCTVRNCFCVSFLSWWATPWGQGSCLV